MARFFGLLGGALKGTFRLGGVTATDWEDIATGPCAPGSAQPTCLFVGDIGDNGLVRQLPDAGGGYVIHRVPEPVLPADGGAVTLGDGGFVSFPFRYPDGPHNAETLLVNPVTGRVYVVTKEAAGLNSSVYRLPSTAVPGTRAVLEYVTELGAPGRGHSQATGGDISICGDRFLLRSYDTLFEFRAPAGSTDPEAFFSVNPVIVPVGSEVQGEAVGYRADGEGYTTVSECAGDCSTLHLQEVRCR